MAVATTLPIKLSDVCLELYGSSSTSGRTLNTCFTDATGTFDATYEGSKDRLQNFRGYEDVAPCTRPTGLTQDTGQIAAKVDGVNYVFYNVSLAQAKSVWDILISFGSFDNYQGTTCEYLSLSIGETVYLQQFPVTDCETILDGWYWFNENIPGNTVDIVTISGGVITAIEVYSYSAP